MTTTWPQPVPDESWQPLFDVDAVFPDAWLLRSCPFAAASLTPRPSGDAS
jgi:hypothetical protein